MLKKVYAQQGKSYMGKTTTLKKLWELLQKKYPNLEHLHKPYLRADITIIVKIKGVIIAIESQGDPKSRLEDSLKLFVEFHANLIFCAMRTKWKTVDIVEALKGDGYEIIARKREKLPHDKWEAANLAEAILLLREIEKALANENSEIGELQATAALV